MRKLLWLVPLLLISCHRGVGPRPPIKVAQDRIAADDVAWIYDTLPVVRFKTPFAYGTLRLQAESCTGKTRAGWPRFYIAPISSFGPGYSAAYFLEQNAIVFGLGSEVNARIVMHELIHFLLAPEIRAGHPPEYFSDDPTVGRCAAFLKPSGS